jgi:hypothetical protein
MSLDSLDSRASFNERDSLESIVIAMSHARKSSEPASVAELFFFLLLESE